MRLKASSEQTFDDVGISWRIVVEQVVHKIHSFLVNDVHISAIVQQNLNHFHVADLIGAGVPQC